MAVRRIIQVAPSNRLHRVESLPELLVELKEQHVKLNEALRQLSLLADEASSAAVTVIRTEITGSGESDHGALDGLADDDHSHYLTTTRHALIDAADHASGTATTDYVLTADGAGGADWAAAPAGALTTHEVTSTYHSVASLTTGYLLTATATNAFGWSAPPAAAGGGTVAYRFAIADPPAGDELYPFQVAPVGGEIIKVSSILVGTGSADINVELEGAEILGADQTVTTGWSASATLTETVTVGDEIAVSLKNVVSPVGYLVVQIDFEAT